MVWGLGSDSGVKGLGFRDPFGHNPGLGLNRVQHLYSLPGAD